MQADNFKGNIPALLMQDSQVNPGKCRLLQCGKCIVAADIVAAYKSNCICNKKQSPAKPAGLTVQVFVDGRLAMPAVT